MSDGITDGNAQRGLDDILDAGAAWITERELADIVDRVRTAEADNRRLTARIAELEKAPQMIIAVADAVSSLNDALNELWGRDDCTTFAQPIGARMLDKIMNAQNNAFFVATQARITLSASQDKGDGS